MTREERRQFLLNRQTGIGGSDVGALLGLSRWADALDVYHSKTRPLRDTDLEPPDSVDLRRGNLLEPVALGMYRDMTGRTVHGGQPMARHPRQPEAIVHVDGLQTDPAVSSLTGVVEVKCPRAATFRAWLDDGLPMAHVLQNLWGQYVHGSDWGTNVAMSTEVEPMLIHADVAYDATLMDSVAAEVHRFWHEHVEPRVPPNVAEWRALGAKLRPPRVEPVTRDLATVEDEVLEAAARRYAEAQAMMKEAQALLDEHKEAVQQRIAELGLEAVQVPAGKFYYRWHDGRRTLDKQKLEGAMLLDWDLVAKGLNLDADELLHYVADISRYERLGEPYRSLRFYANSEGGQP